MGDISTFDVGEDDVKDVKEDGDNKESPSNPSSSPKPTTSTEEVVVEYLE